MQPLPVVNFLNKMSYVSISLFKRSVLIQIYLLDLNVLIKLSDQNDEQVLE
jgi:hypothetical protein